MKPSEKEIQLAAVTGRILGTIAAVADFKELNLPYNWLRIEQSLIQYYQEYKRLKEMK